MRRSKKKLDKRAGGGNNLNERLKFRHVNPMVSEALLSCGSRNFANLCKLSVNRTVRRRGKNHVSSVPTGSIRLRRAPVLRVLKFFVEFCEPPKKCLSVEKFTSAIDQHAVDLDRVMN